MLNSLTYEQAVTMSAQHLVETTDRVHETAIQTPEHRLESHTRSAAPDGTKTWAKMYAKAHKIDELE